MLTTIFIVTGTLVLLYALLAFFDERIALVLFTPRLSGAARRASHPSGERYLPTRPIPARSMELISSSHYHTLPDGRKLYWQRLCPAGANGSDSPLLRIAFVHGFGDHSDFATFNCARAFVENTNCEALLVDMPGHGRSDGMHGLVPDWKRHVDAIEHWLVQRAGETGRCGPETSLYLFGSSMGGAVALELAIRQPKRYAGLLLLAPMVKVSAERKPPPVVLNLLRLLAQVPFVRLLPLVPGEDLSQFCYAESALFRLDEENKFNTLRYQGRTRLLTAQSILKATDILERCLERVQVPFLVQHGELDKVTDSAFSLELEQRARSEMKSCFIVKGAKHGLHYGESKEVMDQVFARMFTWLGNEGRVHP